MVRSSTLFVHALLVLSLSASLAHSVTWTVRQDGSGNFTTIGAAVAAASANDIIEVGPGIYPEQVDVFVTLTFVSTDGAANTTLDGQGTHYTLWFRAGTGHVVDGFTFYNGFHISGGGAIRCQAGARLTLRNSIFTLNRSAFDGGAIFTRDANSFIDAYDCVFRNNHSEHNGAAGIAVLGSRINYTRCQFYSQTCSDQNAGVSCDHSSMDVRDCLFVGNTSASFAGIYFYEASGNVENNTFYNNHSGAWSTVLIHYSNVNVRRNIISNTTGGWGMVFLGGTGEHKCNVFYQNEKGSSNGPLDPSEIVADPQFCDVNNNNFTLNTLSPGAPAENSCGVLLGAYPVACGPVAVGISSFDAEISDGGVSLRATFQSNLTVSEVNVYRAEREGSFILLASPGGERGQFEYLDRSVSAGKSYRYQIGVRDGDGEFMSPIRSVYIEAISNRLDQNRPNPFNPTTTVHYTLATAGHVTLTVYDSSGRVVRSLVNESQESGPRDVTWDGRDDRGVTVASGVYFYKLTAGKFSDTRRMVMLK